MEDSKREVPAEAAADARFFELFKVSSLGMDDGAVRRAADLFQECQPAGNFTGEEIERYWMASALYCVAKLGDCRGFNLSSTLKAAKLNAVDFFREIPQFMIRAGHALSQWYGPEWEKRLEVKEAQTNAVLLRFLSNYYRRAYEEFFLSNNMSNGNNSHSTGSTTSAFVSNYHQFGWLLLLALRIHAFSRFRDLVTCTNGLVSILAILILHVPIQFRKFHVLDSARLVKRSDKGLELLASLCDIYHTSEDDLKAALSKTNNLIAEILKTKPCPASDCHADSLAGINTAGLLYFDGLLDEKSLQSSLLMLEKDYVETSHAKGELDERMFVNDDNSLIGPASPSADRVDVCSSKCKFDTSSPPPKVIRNKFSPPCSPMSPANGNNIRNVMITPTPVSTTMTTAKWLRTVISPLPSKPTVELEHFLSSCDRDLTGDIVRRANIILESIFPCSTCGDRSITGILQGASLMDQIWIDQRKLESMKLYYRVLEAICRAESQMLHGSNLTPLLSNERFHRCMIACAAELVLATHKAVTMMFPAILERTGITAFDLCKVIESFVRYEETLPRELKRHLNSLEERLLESMAWESGSSMYNSLIVARPFLSSVVNKMSLLAEPMPSLDAISNQNASYLSLQKNVHRCETSPERNLDIRSPKRLCTGLRNVIVERSAFTSPVKDRLMGMSSPKPKPPQLQSAFTTPTRQNPSRGGETCAETEMCIFYSKIIKLAASRMKALCEKLQLSNQIMDRVYCLFQQILNQNTSLFFKRHVDQLMLCCIYGVAKISQLTLTFKEIINGYKKQPHCKLQVFRSVFVDWSQTNHMGKLGEDHVDIITFYNVVFIPSVKSLLMEIGSAGSTLRNNQCPGDNNIASGASLGSPRISPFPSLPDMSPKKVSATHNVYVSPLRPSKMDALLSPSSKSFYACVGESTRAYESPSKDLNDINTRLNGGRRVRLNFDIVSDSLVASALGPQNGNSEQAHERSAASDQTIKCEQGNP